jgi:hypothetical protein
VSSRLPEDRLKNKSIGGYRATRYIVAGDAAADAIIEMQMHLGCDMLGFGSSLVESYQ